MADDERVMVASHDPSLVALSIFISLLAAYAAIALIERVRDGRGWVWLAWLLGGATVDGIGTWSMHYTGKLALLLPVPVLFDWRLVVLSLLVSIAGSALALLVLSRGPIGWFRALVASLFMGGVGISGLHYTAMEAMRLPGMHHAYDSPSLVSLSIVMGVGLSLMALTLSFLLRSGERGRQGRYHGSAVLRGAANPVMHYTAMAAVLFVFSAEEPDLSHAVPIESLGLLGISIVPVMGLVVALLTTLVDRLRESARRLRNLSRRLLEVQEEERRHLARELHDEFGQLLSAVNLHLHAARGLAGPAALSRLDECATLLQQAGEQMRSLALELRPTMLDVLGLEAALRWLAEQHQQRTGCPVQVVGHLSGPAPPDLAIACFRVAQEALTNVVRHASARHVWIELSQGDSLLELVVRDDGVGFDVPATQQQAARRGRLGLLGMAERVQLLGGRLDVESQPGHGTRIRASFPLTPRSDDPPDPEE